MKQIGINAFGLCMNLRKLYIPAATNMIGRGVVSNSPSVVVNIDKENKDYKEISNVIVGCTDEARKVIRQTVTK